MAQKQQLSMAKTPPSPPALTYQPCGSHDIRREPFKGFGVLICRFCGEKWLEPAYDNLPFEVQAEGRAVCDALVS